MIKPEAQLEGAGVEETHNSQRLFFIQKELQLSTKFLDIEVTTTSENYKTTLCIPKITVKQKSFFTSAYILSRQKTQKKKKKISRKGKRRRESANEKEKEKKKEKEKEKGK